MPDPSTTTRPAPRPAASPAASPGRHPAPDVPRAGKKGRHRPPPPPPLPQRPGYTLTRDDVDDECPQEWVLRRTVAGTTELVSRWPRPMTHAEAQNTATEFLYGQQIRVAAWKPGRHADEFHASIGATFNAWQILVYSGRGGVLWRRGADGSFTGCGGSHYGDLQTLARMQGPLTPVEVHNLPALVAELGIYRATAGYLESPNAACFDKDCDEYYDDNDQHTGIGMCSHIETRIATAAEAMAMHRVLSNLEWLETRNTPAEADVLAGQYTPNQLVEMAAVRSAIKELRLAIEQEEE